MITTSSNALVLDWHGGLFKTCHFGYFQLENPMEKTCFYSIDR